MALPFFNRAAKKPDQIVAVDLGGRQTKAVLIQRHGERYLLLNFAVRAAPAETDSKELPVETLGEHLKNINVDLGERTKLACIALCENDSLLRHAEMLLHEGALGRNRVMKTETAPLVMGDINPASVASLVAR